MERGCIVDDCLNKYGAYFPSDSSMKNAWCTSLGINRLDLRVDDVVCSDHFSTSDIEFKSRGILRLKKGAIPEIRPKRMRDNNRKCRICLAERNLGRALTDFIDNDITVEQAIKDLAAPIQINDPDFYPNRICKHCFLNLRGAHKFRADLINTCTVLDEQFTKKRKLEEDLNDSKKFCSDSADLSLLDDQNVEVVYETGSKNQVIDDIERTLEEIHGTNLDDDVEHLDHPKLPDINNLISTLPKGLSVKRLSESGEKRSLSIVKIDSKPTNQHHKSDVGIFNFIVQKGLFNMHFFEAEDYLYELGLVKDNERTLKCTQPKCTCIAKQNVTDGDLLLVHRGHNHPPLTQNLKKTNMFLSALRKKMHSDKSLNIKNVYEDACAIDKELRFLVPLKNVINEIFRHQHIEKTPTLNTFEDLYNSIENETFSTIHFTHNLQQFYQERFTVDAEDGYAIVFGNGDFAKNISHSKVMYVDASFNIDSNDLFSYQLVTILVWVNETYYPVAFAFVNQKSQQLFGEIFRYIRDRLAPNLRPQEIVTDYEANLYYALAETYTGSNVGGSIFYYTQNIYKHICSLNISKELESNSHFRSVYHMILMLPLLPVNTIVDALSTIETEAGVLGVLELSRPIFDYVKSEWLVNVTPELFCVHKLESRISENVIAPFKKLRDFLLLTKGKNTRQIDITYVISKLIDLENFLRTAFTNTESKKSFNKDLTSFHKRVVQRAWQFIDDHPKIEIYSFFTKILGYLRCMENQLWIWGFYRYEGEMSDILINSCHFSIICSDDPEQEEIREEPSNSIVVEAVIDQNGVLQGLRNNTVEEVVVEDSKENVVVATQPQAFESAFIKYIYH